MTAWISPQCWRSDCGTCTYPTCACLCHGHPQALTNRKQQ